MTELYTTQQAAREAGISRQSIYLWERAHLIKLPPSRGRQPRYWTRSQVERLRAFARRRYGIMRRLVPKELRDADCCIPLQTGQDSEKTLH